MSKLMRVSFKILDLLVIIMMTFGSPMAALAQDTGPTLMTDKTDYVPGDTVHVSGLGFIAGNYFLIATYPDESTAEWGAVVVDDTLVFYAASPEAVTAEGTYEVTAYAEDQTTVIDSASFTVTAPPPPPAEPELLPFIQSDKLEYAPGELVTLTGGNWQGDTQVRIFVNDDLGQTWSRDVVVEVATDGAITDSFNLPTWFVATYVVVAGGQQTGRAVTTTFSDEELSWDQCQNDTNPNDNKQDPCAWTNGALNTNNSIYAEGDVVPQRHIRGVSKAGDHYTMFDHSFYDAAKDAYTYDFWATTDFTLKDKLNPCNDLAPSLGLTYAQCTMLFNAKQSVPIPTESTYTISGIPYTYPFVAGAESNGAVDGVTRNLWISCGALNGTTFETGKCTNVGITILGHGNSNKNLLSATEQQGPPINEEYVQMKVTYTTPANTYVAIWVGGHLAKTSYWNEPEYITNTAFLGFGSSYSSGASFHQRLIGWDLNQAIGNRDNQIQSSGDTVVPPGSITIIKDDNANSGTSFDFTANSPLIPATFSLSDDGVNTNGQNKQVFANLFTSTYTINELAKSGWNLTSVSCTGTTSLYAYSETGVEINLQPGDNVTCTFTNSPMGGLTVTKTANTSLTRTYSWTIDKQADGDYWKFIGDPATSHSYTVSVDKTANDSNWAVNGDIVITNGAPIGAIITGVADVISSDINATVTCPVTFPYTLASGSELTCTYTTSLPDATVRSNTATVTTSGTVGGAEGTATVSFSNATVTEIGFSSVNVTDTNGQSWGPVSDDASWTYSKDFSCSTNLSDYTNGTDSDVYANVATITETGAIDSASVTVHCYAPLVSKVAAGGYNRAYTWSITKSPDADYKLFAGQSVDHKYTVAVDKTTTDTGFVVAGTITVNNPNPNANMTVDVADSVAGTAATINCGDGAGDTTLTVVAGGSGTCSYTATMTSDTPGTNTATVTLNNIDFPATAGYTFTATTSGYADVNVTDTNGGAWAASGDDTWTYDKTFSCPVDPAAYIDGVYTVPDDVNTATITETKQSDTATVKLTCYAPVVSKTAAGAYTEDHNWKITKSVSPTPQNQFAGLDVDFTWTIDVVESVSEYGFGVSGVITVKNPAPMPMTVALADVLDSTAVTITPDDDCAYADGSLTIPAASEAGLGTANCGYTANPSGRTATKNTATATLNGIAFPAEASITWIPTVLDASVTIDDDQKPTDFPTTISDSATFTYDDSYTCSSDQALYAGDGTYQYSEDNTATLATDNGITESSDATVIVNCYAPVISKTAEGMYDERHEWTVKKTVSPTSQSGFAGDELSFDWTIEVTEEVFEENFDVAGTITVQNPAPMAMTVALVDVLSDATNAVIGSCTNEAIYATGNLTMSANTTTVCNYTTNDLAYTDNAAAPTGNTATATLNSINFIATDPIEWDANVIRGEADLTDEHLNLNVHLTDGYNQTFTEKYTCSTVASEYGDDFTYDTTITNTAVVTSETVEEDRSISTETINCYIPEISKTAAGTYGERHEWDVTKTVDPISQSAFAGDTVSYKWTVTVKEDVYEENFVVTGTITVVNHNIEDAMTVALSDVVDGTPVTITTCTNDADLTDGLTIAAGGTSVCDYHVGLDELSNKLDAPTSNTATAELNGNSYTATDPIEWTPAVTRASVTLDDDQNPAFPLVIDQGGTWIYTEQYTCSIDKSQYNAETHKYTFPDANTATLTGEGGFTDSSNASTAVDCYIPTISKTADGTYDEVHDWDVFKSGAAAQKKFAGQSASFQWTVRVDETIHGENYLVTGDIIVTNPNPEDSLIITLNDILDDDSIATITTCSGGTWADPTLTVPPGGTATCNYSVAPKGDLNDFANALPAQVTMKVDYPESGDPAYFEQVIISGDFDLNGTYEGWCIDQDHTIAQNTNYTANVFSSYEALPAGLVEHPENFDLVNWIINQDYVYKPAGGSLGNYTYGDVQRAIWEFIDDAPFSTSGLNGWNQTRVNQIKTAAIANGEGYTPTCGDFVAVVLQPVGGQQAITIAQVTFASLGVDCAESNAVTAVLNGVEFPASAEILWTANPINPTATLDDTQNPAWPITVSADQTFTYTDPQGYVCPSNPSAYAGDGIAPVYTDSNTAMITYEGGSKSSTASTSVTCYGPIVSKTASAEWRKKYDWTITKTADPTSHTGFAGDTFTSNYDIFVDQTITDYGYLANGVITIKNPAGSPGNMTVNVADMVSGGIAGTVDCDPSTAGDQTSVTIAVNTAKTCTYTVSLPDNSNRVNTATGTFNNIGFPATADVTFGDPIIEGYPTINVTDSIQGALGSASEDKHFTYTDDFSCSPNAADYTNYADSDTYGNTVTIDETGADADASVTVACYIPEISKTADGAYGERHEWDVEKTVTPATQNAFAGTQLSYTWEVVVTEEVFEESFAVSGTITVVNHNPEDAMTVTLSDVVNGTTATITACTDDADLTDGLTIAAGGTSVCDYSVTLPTTLDNVKNAPTNNTATAVLNGLSYTASDLIEWTPTVTRGSATVTDDQIGLNETLTDGATFTGSEQYTCSSTISDYAGNGIITFSETNTAIVTSDGAEEDRDSATETINCYAPVVSKTAVSTYDERHEWTVEKTVNPASQSGFAGDTLPFTWTITVTEDVIEENFKVMGVITVVNPAPMVMTVELVDILWGHNPTGPTPLATIGPCTNAEIEGFPVAGYDLTIPANTTATCDYTVLPPDRADTQNIAQVTLPIDETHGMVFDGYADLVWTANVIRGEVELTDLQGPLSETITGSGSWTVEDNYTCSTDITTYIENFSYSETIWNTATVTSGDYQKSSTTSSKITCFVPEISKTAAGAYDERHEWTIEKTVAPASQSAFAGDTVFYEWTVTVDEDVFEENFVASGTITIVNHNTEDAMTVTLSDVLSDDTAATIIACTGDADLSDGLTIIAGGTSTCTYTAALPYKALSLAPTNNTATAVLNGISYNTTDPIEWAVNVIRGSVTLDDDQNPNLPPTIEDGGTWKYPETYQCSTNKALYEGDNTYPFNESNTATVKDGETLLDSSTASTTVNCYVPTISKTASGTYDEVHDWEVFKSVNTGMQTAFAGEKKNFTWTVRVDETTHGENYVVTGKITVVNPNPEDALIVALSDKLDDNTVATIGPCTGGTWTSPNLTIPPSGTATCDYTVTPKGDMAKFAAALPATVTINSTNPGPDSYWLTTVSNDAALNGVYEAWCVDIDHTMNPGVNYTATVYSSYEAFPAGLIEKPENMDSVNWLINQNFVGKPAGGILDNYTYGDVQRAIWELIEDNPAYTTAGLGVWNQTRVNQIKAAAITNGEGFVPTCGDFVAVLLVPTGGQQPIAIAQVTFASLGIDCAESNGVTAVYNDIEFPASAEILWTVNKKNETASLDDDQKPGWPVVVDADTTFTYPDPEGYTCSTDPAAYTNGFYQYNESNTALLTYDTGFDAALASTAVQCYAPVVTKTAAGAYDERHEWDVEKSVDPTKQNAFAGDTVSYKWTVTVTEDVVEENFFASGTISIKNPRSGNGNMTVKLTDVLSDGIVPTITGCTGGTWNATNQTVAVPPNTTAVCDYTAILPYSDDANAPTNNTVTAELMAGTTHLVTTASDVVEWAKTIIRGSASLDDDQVPTWPLPLTGNSQSGTYTFGPYTYNDGYTCSTTRTDYGETSFWYDYDEDNTAVVTSGDKSDDSKASTVVNCYWPQIELTKTGDGLSKIGDDVTYTIKLENKTSVDANLRNLTCNISDPIIGFTENNVILASGASDTSTKIFTIPVGASDPFVNTASVSCQPVEATAPVIGDSTFFVDDDASWSTNLFQPNVEIIKTGPEYAYYGQVITYTFTVTNNGSSDTPNLMFGQDGGITDTVLGNLTAAATDAGCDDLAWNVPCTFTVNYTVPDQGLSPHPITNVVSVLYHPDGFPNDITDTDDHTVKIVPPSQATNSSLCIYDRDPNRDGQQFRALFTQDPQAWPTYKMNATNPGQFFYNVFATGTPGDPLTFTITLPYPFVTQGANPVHAYDGVTTYTNDAGETCFQPGTSFYAGSQQVILSDYTNGTYENLSGGADGNGGDSVGTTNFPVTVTIPASGFVYVNVHLDYGLKQTNGYATDGYGNAVDLSTPPNYLVPQLADHTFSVSGAQSDDSMIENWNEFKKTPGTAGLVYEMTGEVYTGQDITVELVVPKIGKTPGYILSATADEDGWYQIAYKHTGAQVNYVFNVYRITGNGKVLLKTKTVALKANAFEEVNIILNDTGTDNGTFTQVHVGDMTGTASGNRKAWAANVNILALDTSGKPVANAKVSGQWSNGSAAYCITDSTGWCTVTLKLDGSVASISFNVTDIGSNGYVYDGVTNVKTTIEVNRP